MVLVLCEYRRQNEVRVFCGAEMEIIFWWQDFSSMGDSYGDVRGTWQAYERIKMHRVLSWENLKEIGRRKTVCVGGKKIQGLCGISVPSTATLSLSHRKPFSTGTACDTRGAQNGNKRNALWLTGS